MRDRPEDIAQLARHFMEKFAQRHSAPTLSSESAQWLKAQLWAGNVRELQNVMERALILAEDELVIRPEHLRMPGDSRVQK